MVGAANLEVEMWRVAWTAAGADDGDRLPLADHVPDRYANQIDVAVL